MTYVVLCISGMAGAIYINGVAVTKCKRWGMVGNALYSIFLITL
jgi:hypothetical protein